MRKADEMKRATASVICAALAAVVTVTDGGEPVEVDAGKVAALVRVTADLNDWEGTGKRLDPHAEAVSPGRATMVRIRVTLEDGHAARAFLRIKR